DRGLAGAVGADDGKDLVASHFEFHLVDGQQAAEAHGQSADRQQHITHDSNSTCGRFIGSRPCGRHTIMTTMTRPKISMRYWANSRASSGTTVSRVAARITPTCEPMPPRTTMDRISADSMKVKDSGFTKPWRAAKKAPPKPANMAPMVKAESLIVVGVRPSERQAISSSRRASQARPIGMRMSRLVKNRVSRTSTNAVR